MMCVKSYIKEIINVPYESSILGQLLELILARDISSSFVMIELVYDMPKTWEGFFLKGNKTTEKWLFWGMYSFWNDILAKFHQLSRNCLFYCTYTKDQEISEAFFLETPLPKKQPKFFEGFLPSRHSVYSFHLDCHSFGWNLFLYFQHKAKDQE